MGVSKDALEENYMRVPLDPHSFMHNQALARGVTDSQYVQWKKCICHEVTPLQGTDKGEYLIECILTMS